MKNEYDVRITPQAQEQLEELFYYIAYNLQSPSAAKTMLDTLQNAIASLKALPNRVTLTDEEPWRSLGVHKMVVKSYLVYFLVDEAKSQVQVTAIIFSKRDQARALEVMEK